MVRARVTHVPQSPTLSLPSTELNQDHYPRFDYRDILVTDGIRQYSWRHHNLLNGRRGYETRDAGVSPPAGLDTWSLIWPGINPGQFKEIITNQTLWHSGQVLFMNPQTRDEAVTSLATKITGRIGATGDASHPFHMNDGPFDNPDSDSVAFANAHGGALSAPMLDMVNEVASRVKLQIPQARVETQAYLWAFKPPVGMTAEDNVVVTTAPIHGDLGTPMFEGRNTQIGSDLDGWASVASSVVLWDYHYSTMDFLVPFPDWRAHLRTIKSLATRPEFVGYFAEGQFTDSATGVQLKTLKTWVTSRLLWDPSEDIEALLAEYCDAYYGSGGPHILQALGVLETALTNSEYPLIINRITAGSRFLHWTVLREADRLMDLAAAATANDPVAAPRVSIARMMVDHPIIMRRAQLAHDAQQAGVTWNIDHAARLARLQNNVASTGMINWNYRTPMQILYNTYNIERIAATLPAACQGLPESDYVVLEDYAIWKYHPYANSAHDVQANDHAAVKLDGSRETWGIQLALSELPLTGSWRIHVTARAEINAAANPSHAALILGIYPKLPTSPGTRTEWIHPVSSLSDGQYHEFEIPMDFEHQRDGRYMYITGMNTQVPWLYIDRIYLTRVTP